MIGEVRSPEGAPSSLRRRRWPWGITVAALAIGAGATLWANLVYDGAADRFAAASEELRTVHTEATNLIDAATRATHDAALILAADTGLLTTPATREALARSIAGGVLLEFEWQPMVNGCGDGGSAGGLATWNSGHGGYSTITLSNSVAERWPDAVMKALVTHEVGHAISAKCYHLFDWEDPDANEQWATAWALSLGHTADGNGAALYGYPPQELIDTAATCR